MGGGALKNVPTRRIDSREEYDRIVKDLIPVLQEHFERVAVPQEIPEKKSFGDIDFIVSGPRNAVFEPRTHNAILSKEMVCNGSLTSFEYRGVQIDIDVQPSDSFEVALAYAQYNDLGMIMGKITRQYGCTYGSRGLTITVPSPSQHRNDKVILSRDPRAIFRFFGWDFDVFGKGFETEEDIFKFIVSSPNACFKSFSTSYNARVRPMFERFLAWLSSTCPNKFEQDLSPGITQELALDYFGKRKEYDDIVEDIALCAEFKKKFNGKKVTEWTNLSGRELRAFMMRFNSMHTREELLCMDDLALQKEVLKSMTNMGA
mmetsp:Transcript_12371/g.20071  ORF Transcript_12371/g.20071 Transcript_12371/m.20071 type:complete len:317 (-) Transcript_12371:249-1199(-)